MNIEDLTIVIACNKRDYFFARICVSSIRFYYPDISIELLKDPGNGRFNTTELEQHFDVKVVDLGVAKIGWGAAKLLYMYRFPDHRKILFLDADIVFTGPFLERLLPLVSVNDFVVSAEPNQDPYADWVKKIYFDTREVERKFPDYRFPGYFFNTGQIFITTGTIDKSVLDLFFNVKEYPYWKQPALFPLVDQSLFNYLLPALSHNNRIKIGLADFMIWSKSATARHLTLEQVVSKGFLGGLIHWAGDVRTPLLKKMTNYEILHFFELAYYKRISGGNIKMVTRKAGPFLKSSLKKIRSLLRG